MTRWMPLLLVVAVLSLASTLVSGQRAARDQHAALEGTWNSATATPLERPASLKNKPFFTPAEAAAWERQVSERNEEPPAGAARAGTVTGTYNNFYREWGSRVVKTRRTSIVIEPPDGRIPPLTEAAAQFRHRRLEAMKLAENPEDLGLQDQCRSFVTAGPPLLPYSYNSNYQVIVTREVVAIHAEMIHDARIIHMDGRPHPPRSVTLPLGHSTGRWEGSTLVVDTANVKSGSGYFGDAGGNFGWDENLHLVERFSLFDPKTMLYQFEIDNPTAYTRPWKGELTMERTTDLIYEYACHEANYSLENMMRGYRASERKPGGVEQR